MLYNAVRLLGRFCFGVLGRLEVHGLEAVPPYGPLIIVANHLSFSDPPVMVIAFPRMPSFIAKQEIFGNPLSRLLFREFNVYPFDRSSSGLDAVRLVLRLLAQDQAVVIFPEGHRSPDHSMKRAKAGAAYLALKSQAPILPVGIFGTEKFPSWRMPLPLCRFQVNIGQPFSLPVLEGNPSREVLGSLQDMIMYRIAALLPADYQGVYAVSPSSGTGAVGQPRSSGAGTSAT